MKGFTLIELLVVVLIIGILSSVALPQYTRAVNKSRMTELWTAGKAWADAENVYYLANGKYTSDLTELDITLPALKNFTLEETSAYASEASQRFRGFKGCEECGFDVGVADGKMRQIKCFTGGTEYKCKPLMTGWSCNSLVHVGSASLCCLAEASECRF